MGSIGALGMKDAVDEGMVKLENAIYLHLLRKCQYHPLPSSMVAPCLKAIGYANKGLWNVRVRLPAGILYKGYKTAPVWAMVEQHDLEFFLQPEDDWEDDCEED